jgi:nucleolar protein 56
VVEQIEFRDRLQEYLKQRMNAVAPNLTALIGEMVGSKLISHSGSLINLAKYPASTIQILGAEKALFRALKTKGKTPKYGLIFNSTFIGRAGQKNKGRISRYLANKCAIAARIDSFSEKSQTTAFGDKLREQMEERLSFLATGAKPKKNKDAMKEVLDELKAEGLYYDGNATAGIAAKGEKKAKKDKKRKREDSE